MLIFFVDPSAVIVIRLRFVLPKNIEVHLLFKYNCYVNRQFGSQQIGYGAAISIQFVERNKNAQSNFDLKFAMLN